MSSEPHEQRRCLDDGAYLLGALPPEERASYEEHLRDCPVCRESVAELAGLPGLLRAVPPEVAATVGDPDGTGADEEDVPASLLPAVLARVREERRARTRRVTLLAVAAAAAVLVGAATVVGLRGGAEPGPTAATEVIALEEVRDTPLSVTAELTPVAWGTRIELLCSYTSTTQSPYSVPPEYSLVVRSTTGDVEQVASWRAVPGREVTIEAATAMDRGRIAALEVRTASGDPLLTSVG